MPRGRKPSNQILQGATYVDSGTGDGIYVPRSKWYINGVAVTASAAQLNGAEGGETAYCAEAAAVGKLVAVTGYDSGGTSIVTLADADDVSLRATHVVTSAIGAGATGKVDRVATVSALDTSTFSAVGQSVYMHTTAGGINSAAPTGKKQQAQLAGKVAVLDSGTGGSIFFFPGLAMVERIGQSAIMPSAVGRSAIGSGEVVAGKLGAGSVLQAKIGASAISAAKIQMSSISGLQIKAGGITATRMGASSVSQPTIGASAISAAKIQMSSISGLQIKAGGITATRMGASSVSQPAIGASAISAAKIQMSSVSGLQIKAGGIVASRIGAGAVSNGKLEASAVTSGKITSGSIGQRHIGNSAISAAHVQMSSLSGLQIKAGGITNSRLGAEAVSGGKVMSSTLSAGKLVLGATQGYYGNATGSAVAGQPFPILIAHTISARGSGLSAAAHDFTVPFPVSIPNNAVVRGAWVDVGATWGFGAAGPATLSNMHAEFGLSGDAAFAVDGLMPAHAVFSGVAAAGRVNPRDMAAAQSVFSNGTIYVTSGPQRPVVTISATGANLSQIATGALRAYVMYIPGVIGSAIL